MVKRLSGLQKEVLHLYRTSIRVAHTKPKENQPHFISYAREEFGKYKNLSRKDFTTIEHLLRVGNKRISLYSAPELKDIH
ncbi:YDR379C-A [Zygosaccharomyces parabailii]|uniref:ZYBA0S13-01992g1_1 n=1 Tax=Zygosaccharomyces bailii (strain CLIB 213 / ATCC 58445 / CBS 680 / BCRC 21525 / NBRC 1098 / NCYC 1416 / NRRL Y-2227) TaxID=1333698 RepID=A0A8J2TBB2_ZYGB2|nr:YDR379C-A [Zygosaccharomyces parabailii]CDF91718.1 ZYBA0S13-01992g1_1 [Zygosaccharomyces bailii CLIB 213]SJM87619.1 probable Succinate dehydrogenase assembly factor 1 homolog, mitochondrial [Zygosaccharomyces bailii]